MSTLDVISSSLEPFEILENKKLKSKFFLSSPSLEGLTNTETQPPFIRSGLEFSPLDFVVIWRSDDTTMVVMPNRSGSFYFDALNASRMETKIWKKIAARLTDLNVIFDEEDHERKDKERYLSTSKLLVKVLQCFELKKFPLIGIADDGQVGASWHGGPDGDILFILPSDKSDVSISYVNEEGELSTSNTTLNKLENNNGRAILPSQKELPWYN